MDFATLPQNLSCVRDEIASIQASEGLDGPVQVVAVTKGHPVAAVTAAHAAGISDVGENRVQEALSKQDVLTDLPVRWHLIGHVQTNKAKFVPGRFHLVHSIDSVRLVDALQRAAGRLLPGDAEIDVLVQVNVAHEPQKSGCDPEELDEIVERLVACSALRFRGLMTMAPLTNDERMQREVFASLRRLRDELQSSGHDADELSMGMSGDYRAAVAEGATILRLGTVLFGERPR
jgi:pyridoxal phosphate enzyme (YggS family)